jgi:threonine/homoserine/homoserine lactone efflux protein
VSLRRLRGGELLALAGGAALALTLFLDWVGPHGRSGWSSLGWLVLVFALAAVACAAWLTIATVAARPLAQVVAAAVLTATVGTFAFVALAVRALVFQPGPNDSVVLRYGAYLGLLAALLTAIGGWWAIADERTDAPESAYTPPPPRPAPPPFAS